MPDTELRSLYPFRVVPMVTNRAKRWRVERAGYAGHYELGWFALDPAKEQGAWFPTMTEAVKFANAMAEAPYREENARRGRERRRKAHALRHNQS